MFIVAYPIFLCCYISYSFIVLDSLGSMCAFHLPPPPLPPPRFVFHGELSVSEHSAEIYSVISQLPSSNLKPDELLRELKKLRVPLGIDFNDLGHAYYSHYWHVQKKPSVALKINIKPNQIREAVEVPKPTAYDSEHDDRICNLDYEPNYLMGPSNFVKALRAISPREIMGQYYHNPLICGGDFDDFIDHVNETLKTYFITPDYAVGHEMNRLLSGIIKCICLRVLSSSSYYYAYKSNHEINDIAMKHLLEFYKMTDLIHAWNEQSFNGHLHMISKYNTLKHFIDKVLDLDHVGTTFMSDHYFTFEQITHNLELVLFDNLYEEPAYVLCESFPHCITDLKRQISSDDIFHSMQSYSRLNP